jgi:hypothetical protein
MYNNKFIITQKLGKNYCKKFINMSQLFIENLHVLNTFRKYFKNIQYLLNQIKHSQNYLFFLV